MKPEELRIGNWVEYKEKQIQIKCADFPEFELGYLGALINPIHLTAEWLEKFGFKKHSEGFYKEWGDKNGFHGYLLIDDPDWFKGLKAPNGDRIDDVEKHPLSVSICETNSYGHINPENDSQSIEIFAKYVHQLQNLYHALTNEEL